MSPLLFLIGLSVGLLPIPCLIYAAAFTERRKLYKDIEREEALARLRAGGAIRWKKRILK